MPQPITEEQLKALYTEACKNVLSEKCIATRILKEYAEDYKDVSVADIIHKYIQGKPEIGARPRRRCTDIPPAVNHISNARGANYNEQNRFL